MLCKSYTLKPGSHIPKKFGFFCFSESPLKIIKNAFYFILKALFILKIIMLRYLNFCPDFFGHVGKRLDKKVKVNFKV